MLSVARLMCIMALFAPLLAACEEGYADRVEAIEKHFRAARTGSSPDYLLVKYGIGGRDPVAVIFGFMSDAAFCDEIAKMYMERYAAAEYRCEPIN